MKKVLASKSNTRVNSKNLNPSTLIEDLSNNVHTENIALDAVMNVIELNSAIPATAAKKGGESSQAEVVVVPSGAAKKESSPVEAVPTRVRTSKRSVYDANSSDSEGDEFPPASTIWTTEADNKLRSAFQLFGDDWSKIAAYLDIGQTGSQCMNRWHSYVNPALPLIVDGWTPFEIDKLKGLIAHQQRGIVSRKINWKVISAEMNREVASCQSKWRSVQGAHLHSGRFSAEEDDVILEEVSKWGDRGHGLWKAMEKRLNRSAESIYKHYQKRLARRVSLPLVSGLSSGGGADSGDELEYEPRSAPTKRSKKEAASAAGSSASSGGDGAGLAQTQPTLLGMSDDDDSDVDEPHMLMDKAAAAAAAASGGGLPRKTKKPAYVKKGGLTGCGIWTPEMDAQLIEAQRILGNDWVKVAEYCNNGQNNKQCGLRFNLYLDPKLKTKVKGDWTPEEIEQLKSLVVEFQSGGAGKKINWTTISRELNRDYNACKNKWKTVVGATMKRGPFTADEDELIIQRVQEWGNKGHGLWTQLEKEMGRSLKFIFQRWKLSLQKQVELNGGLENLH